MISGIFTISWHWRKWLLCIVTIWLCFWKIKRISSGDYEHVTNVCVGFFFGRVTVLQDSVIWVILLVGHLPPILYFGSLYVSTCWHSFLKPVGLEKLTLHHCLLFCSQILIICVLQHCFCWRKECLLSRYAFENLLPKSIISSCTMELWRNIHVFKALWRWKYCMY